METRYALWDEPQPTCPQAAFTAASYNRSRRPREGPWRGISIEPSGKGSFQAVKLQRPARATVCSHSTRDMAATRSIESKHDHNRDNHRERFVDDKPLILISECQGLRVLSRF